MSLKPIDLVAMESIPAKRPLSFGGPVRLLLEPVASEELPNTCIVRFLLRGLERDQLVEVLIQCGRLTRATSG